MEPQIRYVKSADGTRIAMCALGQGPPLIILNNFYLTIEIMWDIPEMIANMERLSQHRTVVMYDARGAGLSKQHVSDFSGDANVSDLVAVTESIESDSVDILCPSTSSFIGITYAARYPDEVRRLILHSPVIRGSDFFTDTERNLLLPIAAKNWAFYLQCLALLNHGWTEPGRRVAERQVKEASRVVWQRSSEEWSTQDVSSLIPLVKCPTLILEPRHGTAGPRMGSSSEVAAAITGARLARITQDHPMVLATSWDSCLRIVEEFLDEGLEATNAVSAPEHLQGPSGTAIILFADIVDSTALTERLGDAAFRDKARTLDEAMRAAIRDNGGTAVEGKTLGDGVLAVFTSAKQAIACAQACHNAATAAGLSLHVGIHAGDVIREDDNVYGGAVNIAARVASASAAGETLVSGTVRDLARTSAGVEFEDRGEQELKGIGEPVRVWAVRQA